MTSWRLSDRGRVVVSLFVVVPLLVGLWVSPLNHFVGDTSSFGVDIVTCDR